MFSSNFTKKQIYNWRLIESSFLRLKGSIFKTFGSLLGPSKESLIASETSNKMIHSV